MRLKNLNWDENTLIWRKYANCHIAGGGDTSGAKVDVGPIVVTVEVAAPMALP